MSDDKGDYGHLKSGRARAALTGVLWTMLTTLTPTVVTALVFLLTSRILSPADFGLVAFAGALILVIAAFSPAGFSDAIIQRKSVGPVHFNTVFWLCFAAGIVLYLLVLAISLPISWYYHNPMLAKLMPVLGLRIIIDQLTVVPRALLSRSMSFRKIAIRAILASITAAVVCLAVLYAGFGLWALVCSQLVISLVACIVSWMSVDWRPTFSFSRSALREMAGFGTYSWGSQIIGTINVEQLMIGGLMGPAVLGLMSFARRLYQMISDVMITALGAVTYPLLASMQHETAKLRHAYLTATLLSSILAFPSFIGLALVADELIPLLFGPQWVEAVTPLRALCSIGILACIGTLQSSLIRSKGRADIWMWYQLVQQGLTVIVVLATYRHGIGAVAIGIALKTWLVWPFTARIVGRLIELPLDQYLGQFLAPLTASFIMAAAVMGMRYAMGGGVAALFAQILVGMICYGFAILILARRRLGEIWVTIRRRKT